VTSSSQILASDEQSLKLQSGGMEVYEFSNVGFNTPPASNSENIALYSESLKVDA
jgi:hypothetical protein